VYGRVFLGPNVDLALKKPEDWSKDALMEPTDDVGGTMFGPIGRMPGKACRPSGELRRRLIGVAALVGFFAIVGGISMVTLLKVSPSGSAQLRSPRSHSPAPRRAAPADEATATFSATIVAEPNMDVTSTGPVAEVRPTDVAAISSARNPVASPTTTTVQIDTDVHVEVTERRPVISRDTTPMSVPSNETYTIISP
jgi:hypothetical protein